MKVRATKLGFYNHSRKRPGEEFVLVKRKGKKFPPKPMGPDGKEADYPKGIDVKLVDHVFTPEEQFSNSWMEKVEDEPLFVKGKRKKQPEAEAEEEIQDEESVI